MASSLLFAYNCGITIICVTSSWDGGFCLSFLCLSMMSSLHRVRGNLHQMLVHWCMHWSVHKSGTMWSQLMLWIEIQRWPISGYTTMPPTYLRLVAAASIWNTATRQNLGGEKCGKERKITYQGQVRFATGWTGVNLRSLQRVRGLWDFKRFCLVPWTN